MFLQKDKDDINTLFILENINDINSENEIV